MIRKFVRIVVRNTYKMKISTGLVVPIVVTGVGRCGGAVVKLKKKLQVVNLPSMKQKMMRKRKKKKTSRIKIELSS